MERQKYNKKKSNGETYLASLCRDCEREVESFQEQAHFLEMSGVLEDKHQRCPASSIQTNEFKYYLMFCRMAHILEGNNEILQTISSLFNHRLKVKDRGKRDVI